MRKTKNKLTPTRIIIHLGAWIPLLLIVFNFFSGNLTVNPIQDIEQRTGRLAILWVMLSLSCTPLASIFGWKELIKRRRTVGLYAFMMAAIHVTIFLGLDFGLNWKLIWQEIVEKRFIFVGAISFIGLSLLAATSFTYWQKTLKKNWKRLHKIIYLIGPLVVIHYAWAKKGDLFSLQGDIVKPLIYAGVVTLLLVLRIKPVKLGLKKFWYNLTQKTIPRIFSKKTVTSESISG
ncbi:MAG: sulfoxide reductase heme-binding subunit YedZ [Anaerolineales bacterium]|jgi:sulfoxide reductase heme-binding subunit YedZ